MGKRERRTFTEEFKREAVRLTETSGRTIAQVADDLGLGLSTLTRWKRRYRDADLLAKTLEARFGDQAEFGVGRSLERNFLLK